MIQEFTEKTADVGHGLEEEIKVLIGVVQDLASVPRVGKGIQISLVIFVAGKVMFKNTVTVGLIGPTIKRVSEPCLLEVNIEGKNCKMEVDSGSTVSVISKADYIKQ